MTPARARVLIDTSVFRRSKVAEAGVFTETIQVGSQQVAIRLLDVRQRPLPSTEHRWLREQIEALPTIARLARENRVSLCSYSELEHEAIQGTYFPSGPIGDLFGGLKWEQIPAAIERSRIQQMDFSDYVKKSAVMSFCAWLLSINPGAFDERPRTLNRFSEFERRNLRDVSRFRQICSGLANNHHPDAFHLWTAEVNNVDYFVLADQRFINAMTLTSRVALRTKVVSPCQLLHELRIAERDPMPP